jgi:hypothetical protein
MGSGLVAVRIAGVDSGYSFACPFVVQANARSAWVWTNKLADATPLLSEQRSTFFVPGSVKYQQPVCFQHQAEPWPCRRFLGGLPMSFQPAES